MGLIAPASFGAPAVHHLLPHTAAVHAAAADETGQPGGKHEHAGDCQGCPLGACGMSLADAAGQVFRPGGFSAALAAARHRVPLPAAPAFAIAFPRGPPAVLDA